MSKINNVNSWNGWDPLEQILLGNTYSPEFFNDVTDSRTRDLLQKLSYETIEDLNNFKRQLELAGVDVVQVPEGTSIRGKKFNSITDTGAYEFDEERARYAKFGIEPPMLTPRDYLITLGNKVVYTHQFADKVPALRELFEDPDNDLDTYLSDTKYDQQDVDFGAPYITRAGKRIIVDDADVSKETFDYVLDRYPEFERVTHTLGGHNDGSFCPLKPGYMLSTTYVDDFSKTFPDWKVIEIGAKEVDGRIEHTHADFDHIHNQKEHVGGKTWWTPDAKENKKFCEFVETWMNDWTGWAIESIFEVNVLVVSPELVFCPTYDEVQFKKFREIGMEPVHVPFRHRYFWDGGLHCLTLDTRRRGEQQDYWR